MFETVDFLLPGEAQDDSLVYSLLRCRPSSGGPSRFGKSTPISLVFVHGIGTHKETWLPVIEHLFEIQAASPQPGASIIVEAWIIDFPNHGQAGIINEDHFLRHPEAFGSYQGGRMLRTFLGSGLVMPHTNIIIVGHSCGTLVTVLSTIGYSPQDLPYSRIILVEPAMMSNSVFAKIDVEPIPVIALMELTKARKDIWPSRAAAHEWLRTHSPWKGWHPRSLELFVEHGLRDLPTAKYPHLTEGVTLSCTREQESFCYSGLQDCVDALERLRDLCTLIPIDCIFGNIATVISHEMQQGVFDMCRDKPKVSITVLEGAGHLIVQEDPHRLAATIWASLNKQKEETFRSRL
ncbi:hypothetical protein BV25DRAFT_1891561 [Artomyces pyxidatus]|uniref:Uncharacterized protein n=1 Tax=Artomyces pyxidatus TaxID=48021 RepID=A0ACB8SQY8_9AGAM|nr:hypothetical protein BV25DRAFT_1891561 [Artomyces pyxidatus]